MSKKLISLDELSRFKGKTYEAIGNSAKEKTTLLLGKNLFNVDGVEITNGYIQGDGSVSANNNYFLTDYIFLPTGTYCFKPTYKICLYFNERITVCMFNLNKKQDSNVGIYTSLTNVNYISFTMLKDGYVRLCFQRNTIDHANSGWKYYAPILCIGTEPAFIDDFYCYSKKYPEFFNKNDTLIDTDEVVNGYPWADGRLNESSSYKTTGYIKVFANKTYSIKGVARFIWYLSCDAATNYLYENQTNYQFTPTKNGYLMVSATLSNFEKLVIVESSIMPTEYVKPGYTLKDTVQIPSADKQNILNGKIYVACGDSFTKGGYAGTEGIDVSVYTYQDGAYSGQQKTYPLILGLRNNMTVINEAVGGSTMARWSGDGEPGSFANTRYKNIPSNADYITLKFGINDENKNIPIGTIDSSDVYTFYGAWNTVMEYIISHHPKAKIGIIISNGIYNQDYCDATRNIAEKWGIPYLDEQQGKLVPLLNRVYRTGVSASAQNVRNSTFRISETNTHPNVDAQEYESTIVENFLRTL